MSFKEGLEKIKEFLNIVIFDIQGSDFTLWTLIYIITASFLLFWVSRKISSFFEQKILITRVHERGTRLALSSILRYSILCIGMFMILKSSGFDLSTLSWLVGALGVGIGFGLQNITNNFISGIIILFERPIKVGDRIEVAHINGDVKAISMRATTILTNDNISVIVPNSEFINSNVINWSHNDRRIRFHFPVGVSYNEDPQKVKEIVLKIANENEGVLKSPPPDFWFTEFGDSSLNFELVVWTSEYVQRPIVLKSQLYYRIFEEFTKEGIEIPFPQRDLHIRGGEVFKNPEWYQEFTKSNNPSSESSNKNI